MEQLQNIAVNRRAFLKIALSTYGAYFLPGVNALEMKNSPEGKLFTELSPFIKISSDNQIEIFINLQEMGQGVRTSLSQLLCEELECDIHQVKVTQAPANETLYGRQLTGGSGSIRRSWTAMRKAGAAAKSVLVSAAADMWQVKVEACQARNGHVINTLSGETQSYGKLVEKASRLPLPKDPKLKSNKDFTLIGKNKKNVDINDIVSGKPIFSSDLKLKNMRHATIIRSPTVNGSLVSLTRSKRLKENNFLTVYHQTKLPLSEDMPETREGVVIVGPNTWSVFKARQQLEVKWSKGQVNFSDSQQTKQKLIQKLNSAGVSVRQEGDKVSTDGTDFIAQYYTPIQSQAQMEPMTCTVLVNEGECKVWGPVQWPQFIQGSVASYLKLNKDQVKVQPVRMGGSFGRKYCDDFVIECVAIANKFPGTPIQLNWTREDDLQCGGPQIPCAHLLSASSDDEGNINRWLHRVVHSSPTTKVAKSDDWQADHGQRPMPFDVDNISCEFDVIPADMHTTAHRAVFYPTNAFAINCFVDEMARASKQDPLSFHQSLLGKERTLVTADWQKNLPPHLQFKTSRLSGVIERLKALVPQKPAGWGRGFAAQRAMLSYVAAYVDVTVVNDNIWVKDVYCVVDCGLLVNPDGAQAQIESSIIWGISTALTEQLTLTQGKVEQSNFHDYQVMRMAQVPNMHIEFIPSDMDPTGVGEPAVTVMAPALGNAIFDCTNNRLRSLPFNQSMKQEGFVSI